MAKSTELVDRIVREANDFQLAELDALSIGGSVGRGAADDYSDIDLFVLIADPDVHAYATNRLPRLLERLGVDALKRGPVYVDGFGYSCTLVFSDLSVCQLNFNSRPALTPSAAWANSHCILFDRTGFMRRLIRESAEVEVDIGDSFSETYRYFWIRALFASRSIRRNELWRTLGYVAEMRNSMLTILRIQQEMYEPGLARSSLTRFETEVGKRYAEEIAFAAPSYDAQMIRRSLRSSAQWFERHARLSPHYSVLRTEDIAIATSIRIEIECP